MRRRSTVGLPPLLRPRYATIRAAVVARAAQLKLKAYTIAQRTKDVNVGRPISDDGLKLFFDGKTALSADRLDAVFEVLGLTVVDRY
jgi:hypothetical protein